MNKLDLTVDELEGMDAPLTGMDWLALIGAAAMRPSNAKPVILMLMVLLSSRSLSMSGAEHSPAPAVVA